MDKREKVARAICAEKCAFMGEPPCYTIEGDWPNPNCSEPGCHAEAQAAIAALGPVDRPRVKPFEWQSLGEGYIGLSLLGEYQVYPTANKRNHKHSVHFVNASRKSYMLGYFEPAEAAKAAAQADYEARILAALEPVTVRTCAKCGHPENNHPYKHPFVPIAQEGADSG